MAGWRVSRTTRMAGWAELNLRMEEGNSRLGESGHLLGRLQEGNRVEGLCSFWRHTRVGEAAGGNWDGILRGQRGKVPVQKQAGIPPFVKA